MPDREKVIRGLETIRFNLRQMGHGLLADFCDDALALLKEQDDEIAKFCGEVARLTAMLEEQETEIRQLKLALDIAKGTCNGIVVEGR